MAMIALPVVHEIGRLFRSIDVPGNRDPSDHITLLYLGDDVPIKTIMKIIPIVYEITSNFDPFLVSTKKITTFAKGDSGYPLIAPIESESLIKLHGKLKRAFDKHNIKYSKKFPEYKPHITLGYNSEKIEDIKFPKTSWQINEVAIFGGDNDDERIYVSFPLSLKIMKKSAEYISELAEIYRSII